MRSGAPARVPALRASVRMGVVWCPQWPVMVAGFRPGEPVAVAHDNRIVACSPAASHEGVVIGMRRRAAQARCPALRLAPHDPAADARAFEAVARAVGELTPRLEITEPGVLAFAARGPSRYFGGDAAMAERVAAAVLEGLAAFSEIIPIGVGVADGRFAAAVAARRASRVTPPERAGTRVVPPGSSAAFLAPRPVALLHEVGGLPAEFVDIVMRLGLPTLGALASLPAADVLARFGDQGAFAHRIAGGGDDRPPRSAVPPPEWSLQHAFDEPVQHLDIVAFVAKQMAAQLTEALAAEGKVCVRLVVRAETEHGERSERVWHRPTGLTAAAVVERVRWQLDGWVSAVDARDDAPTGGVVLLRFVADEVRADQGAQLGFWGGRTHADEWAARAVARVSALAGDRNVLVPARRGGRLPQDAYAWTPAAISDLAEPADRLAPAPGPWPGQVPAPSPSIVYPDPLPADVRDADGARVRVSGRGIVSAAPASVAVGERAPRRVVAWAGPWPMDEKWWRPDHRRMARFQLLTADDQAYLVAAERQGWWVIGRYA